jgi:uncharacterized membrane protein
MTRIGLLQAIINEIVVLFALQHLVQSGQYASVLWLKCKIISALQMMASRVLASHTLSSMDFCYTNTKMAISSFTLTYHNKSISILFQCSLCIVFIIQIAKLEDRRVP